MRNVTKRRARAGLVLAGLLSLPAAAQEADPAAGRPDLDGPAAAAALLEILAGAAPGAPELPVIGPADAEGAKWIRALVPHADWPVLVPFALRVAWTCGPERAEVSDPGCWRVTAPEAAGTGPDAAPGAAPGEGS